MAEPSIMDLKKATIKFVDGAGTPAELTLKIDEGNLQFTSKFNMEYKRDRGKLATGTVREGDEEPMDVSLECRFSAVKSSTGESITVMEFLKQTGAGSSLTTTGAACEPFAVDIVVTIDQNCGTVPDEIITFPAFRVESIGGSFKDGTLSLSGKCKAVMPTSVRTTLA